MALLTIAVIVGIPTALTFFLLIGCFVRSYDWRTPRVIARAVMALSVGTVSTALVAYWLSLWPTVSREHPIVGVVVSAAFALMQSALLFVLWDADLPEVYASALVGLLVLAFPELLRYPGRQQVLAALVAVLIVGLYIWSRRPLVRIRRYTKDLEGCWCCQVKQRALRELLAFGDHGRAVIEHHLAGRESWYQNQIRAELRDASHVGTE
jgi:hypothetical protein